MGYDPDNYEPDNLVDYLGHSQCQILEISLRWKLWDLHQIKKSEWEKALSYLEVSVVCTGISWKIQLFQTFWAKI
ncbi:hypothetical protein XELAEV_18000300mg [Xenopus laevis]|uniref:Uncharacterized protein n=1 Tax=Xenopus laevis TaxID=8355 RepID=A0A974BP77_XENLA|nr:hypothetical protein XELAEV_18000300mg [Xenopus laevis]